jgi:hypothetical protein
MLDATTLDRFHEAQKTAITALQEVVGAVQVGMTEVDVAELCNERIKAHGFTGHFCPPEVMVGARTAKQKVWATPSGSARIEAGEPVIIDIAPSTGEAFGNIGTTIVLPRGEEPPVVSVARECARGCLGYGNHLKTVGEIFVFARAWAVNHRVDLANPRSIGHRMLAKEGQAAWDYPKMAHRLTWLRRHQVHVLNPGRLLGLWSYRPQLTDGHVGAAFREAIYIDGDQKLLLGRDSLDDAFEL